MLAINYTYPSIAYITAGSHETLAGFSAFAVNSGFGFHSHTYLCRFPSAPGDCHCSYQCTPNSQSAPASLPQG